MKKIIVSKQNIWVRKMAKKYSIPPDSLKKILKRDKHCVYCHKKMILPGKGIKQRNCATVEHMKDKSPFNIPETIAICCGSCNSSRRMSFTKWFKSQYCLDRNINEKTVANPVKAYMRMIGRMSPEKRKTFVLKNY